MSEGWKSTHKFSKVNALRKRKGGKSLFSTGRTKTLIFNLYLLLQKPQAFSAEKLHLREQMEGISTPYSQRWLLGGRKSGWQLFPSWLALEPERSPEFLPFMHQKRDVNSHLSVTFPLFSWIFLLWMLLSTLSGPSSVCMNCLLLATPEPLTPLLHTGALVVLLQTRGWGPAPLLVACCGSVPTMSRCHSSFPQCSHE